MQKRVVFTEGSVSDTAKQIGFAIAIAINLILAWIVANILEWDWLPFLTDDFAEVETIMIISILIGAFANLLYLIYDSRALRLLGDVVTGVVGLFVIVRLFNVFPFAFESGPWEGLIRGGLIFVGIAVTIGSIANLAKLIKLLAEGDLEATS